MILVIVGTVWPAIAQTDPLRAEIEARIQAARNFELPENSEFVIETLFGVDAPAKEEVDRLRRLVGVDRSAEYNLARIQLEEESGGSRRRVEYYVGSDQAWRINSTLLTHPGAPYFDAARGRDGYWTLSPDQLQFAKDPSSLPADVPFDPEKEYHIAHTVLAWLTTGIAGTGKGSIEITEIERSLSGASIMVRGEERSLLIEGVFELDSANDQPDFRIDRVHVLDLEGNRTAVNEYKDWRDHPELGIRLAHHCVTTLTNGKIFSEYRVTHAGPLSHDVSEVTRTPPPDGEDVLRGTSTYRSVVDHTRGLRSMLDSATGELVASDSTRSSYSSGTRVALGALMVAVAVATFAAVRKGQGKS